MDKKFTVCVPFYVDDDPNYAEFALAYCIRWVNDLLHVHELVSLNEVLRAFNISRRYSYRWGYDLKKDGYIGVQVIKNPANPKVWYLKFTARDIVEDR